MITIRRKFNNEYSTHNILTQEECKKKDIQYVYWQNAKEGDMALSDDGYVGECVSRKEYDKSKVFVKTIYGVQWVRKDLQLNFLPNYEMGIYSLIKPLNWGERESKQQRTKNVVNAYIGQLMSPYQVDWNILGNVYRPEQRRPDLSVKRLFKNKMVKGMIEDKLKEVMTEKGITRSFVLDKMLSAIEIAEGKQDVGNILKATDSFMDLLEMKPSKRVTTDTMQIDMTSQIADQIETEEKKLIMSRKTEGETDAVPTKSNG